MYTPLDIENKKFSKKMMNGYDVEEVDDFLDQLTVDYGKMYKESSELKKKIEELEKSMEHYKAIEATLQNTLVYLRGGRGFCRGRCGSRNRHRVLRLKGRHRLRLPRR